MLENIFRIYYTIKYKLFPVYTGPSTIKYMGSEVEVPNVLRISPDGKKVKSVRVNYFRNLTIDKVYQAERQDRISYYLRDDNGSLCEVNKSNFKDISEERNKILKKIGI